MNKEDIIQFLQKVPPFQFLDETALKDVSKNIAMEFYPKDKVILMQDGVASDSLRIIKKGGVRISVRSGIGEDVVIDFRGEGDTFGIVSLMSKDRQKTTIVAIDDTICYLLKKEDLYRLIESQPAFTEYLLQSHFSKYIDKTYSEMHNKSLFYGNSDHLLFTTRIGDIATKDIIAVGEYATILRAAQEMARNRISSIIILDVNEQPSGIVTDSDIREKVVARARNYNDLVRDIMSRPLVRVDVDDYCFEAVLRMVKHNIHHMVVMKDGNLKGVLTNHDLMHLQGSSPLSVAKDLESQHTIEGLAPVSMKIDRVVGLLLKEGARASNITKIIAELNDRLVRKVLDIAEKKFGNPPLPYCWVALGSEGRKEQTFKTDQDNAIVFADPETASQDEEARCYFAGFTAYVKDSLLRCGFPPCPADSMAGNPRWCQPLRTWKKYLAEWMATPTPDALMNALAFLDFRPVYGEHALAEDLRTYCIDAVMDKRVFLGHLANMAIRNPPPIGFFRSFVIDKDGAHKDGLNLNVKGLAPLVDIIRLFALERGVRETSTLERITALRGAHAIMQEYADEFEHVFEFIMHLSIHHQFSQQSAGGTADNFVDPNKLSGLEKRSVKDAFHFITKMRDLIIERYKTHVW